MATLRNFKVLSLSKDFISIIFIFEQYVFCNRKIETYTVSINKLKELCPRAAENLLVSDDCIVDFFYIRSSAM
jgi:hypothetical protein